MTREALRATAVSYTHLTPDPNHAVEKPAADTNRGAAGPVKPLPPADVSPLPVKAKDHNIRVSPAVLDAAGKEGDALLASLRTTPDGLTQAEAEQRARTSGPNEVAQERKRGWLLDVYKRQLFTRRSRK